MVNNNSDKDKIILERLINLDVKYGSSHKGEKVVYTRDYFDTQIKNVMPLVNKTKEQYKKYDDRFFNFYIVLSNYGLADYLTIENRSIVKGLLKQ